MSQSANPHGWEKFKSAMRGLYLVKGHPLEGPEGLILLMETRHGFKATKAQYEKQFRIWGFQKHRTKEDWKVMGQKIERRKRSAKESNVYLDGELVPTKKLRKEISRQGYMTYGEQLKQSKETPPQTPQGFDIRTPAAQPLFRLIFENIPILQFQENIQSLCNSIGSLDSGSLALGPFFGKSLSSSNDNHILPIINSLLPISAFVEEPSAKGLAIEKADNLGAVGLFSLTTFLISNNFPGETNTESIYEWLKKNISISVLRKFSSIKHPTAEAVLEKLFRFAIEAEDLPTVKYMLNAGMNPNGHLCRHPNIPDALNPLQFACIRGNAELVKELIKAGSSIDQPGHHWKSSALVLAIVGGNFRYEQGLWDNEVIFDDEKDRETDDAQVDEQDGVGGCNSSVLHDNSAFQEKTTQIHYLLDLVNYLIDAGASVNPRESQRVEEAHREEDDDISLDRRLQVLLDGHSPLTAASKYKNKELVDLLIQKEADVYFTTRNNTSALYECLWTGADARDDIQELTNIMSIVHSLLEAGVDANGGRRLPWRKYDLFTEDDIPDIFDLAMETRSMAIIGQLSGLHAPISKRAVRSAIQANDDGQLVKFLLAKQPFIRQTVLIEAVRLGKAHIITYMFQDGPSRCRELLQGSSEWTLALQDCCRSGYANSLRQILDESSKYNCSLSPWFGASVYMAVSCRHDEIVDILLSAGADVNAVTRGHETALVAATKHKNKKLVETLIKAGANVHTVSLSMEHQVCGDALIAAIEWGDYTVIDGLLQAGANTHVCGVSSNLHCHHHMITPLTAAILKKDLHLSRYFISSGAALNNPDHDKISCCSPSSLSAAISLRDLELINLLIQAGANPYDGDALKEATCDFGLLQVILAALHGWKRPINSRTIAYRTLESAIKKQDQQMIKAILVSPLVDNAVTPEFSQAFVPAFYLALNDDLNSGLGSISILLSLGLDPNQAWRVTHMRPYAKSALCIAIMRKNLQLVELLLDAGAQTDRHQTCGIYSLPIQAAVAEKDEDIVRVILKHKGDPNADFGYDQHTPLQIASRDGSKGIVELLLEHGADVNAPPAIRFGATALQFAAMNGLLGVAFLLLENGAEVNALPGNIDGRTALEVAAEHGRTDMVQLLLNAGANIFGEGQSQYENAMRRASENGHHSIRRLLESYHASRSS